MGAVDWPVCLVGPAQVQAVYCVNKVVYLVLKSYVPLHSTPDGPLVLPSESTSVRKVVALGDLHPTGAQWHVGGRCQ